MSMCKTTWDEWREEIERMFRRWGWDARPWWEPLPPAEEEGNDE